MFEVPIGESLFRRVEKYFGETGEKIFVGAICLGLVTALFGFVIYFYSTVIDPLPFTLQATIRLALYVLALLMLMFMFLGYLNWKTATVNLKMDEAIRTLNKRRKKSLKLHNHAVKAWDESMGLVDEVQEMLNQMNRIANRLEDKVTPESTKEVERRIEAVRKKAISRRRKKKSRV